MQVVLRLHWPHMSEGKVSHFAAYNVYGFFNK